MFKPIERNGLYVEIVDQITQSILSGKIHPGDRLPTEGELATQFGVSRTVVREAIKALTAQGLVEVSRRRGTFVAKPSAHSVIKGFRVLLKLEDSSFDQLLTARRLLEGPIARMAAENVESSDLEALEEHLEGMRANLEDIDTFIEHDTAFHEALAKLTKNFVLTLLTQIIVELMRETRQIATQGEGVAQDALGFHERILAAVKEGDGELAEKMMDEHIDQVMYHTRMAREKGLIKKDGM